MHREITRRIETTANAAPTPIDAVIDGCEAFLANATGEEFRTIALLDGPSVLGWNTWRAIDAEHGLGSLTAGLRHCHDTGNLADHDPVMVAHLLSGALNEAVFVIAQSDDSATAHRHVAHAVRELLTIVLGSPDERRDLDEP